MRAMGWAALAALALAVAGCGNPGPTITDEQTAVWQAVGARSVPAAQDIEISSDVLVCMGTCGTKVEISMTFANFADMAASAHAVTDFQRLVDEQANGALVTVYVANTDEESFVARVVAKIEQDVPGVVKARVLVGNWWVGDDEAGMGSGIVRVFVDDTSVVTPEWLDEVVDAAQTGFTSVNGRVTSISIFPSRSLGPGTSDSEAYDSIIWVESLDSFMALGAAQGCVRTSQWAYDVSQAGIGVYPADRAGGKCA